jgi:regulator of G-protein signaling
MTLIDHHNMLMFQLENILREMQDAETGVPVRSQKLFLTSIPAAFMGMSNVASLG